MAKKCLIVSTKEKGFTYFVAFAGKKGKGVKICAASYEDGNQQSEKDALIAVKANAREDGYTVVNS